MEERNEKQDRNSRFSEGKVEKMNSQLKMGNLELGSEGDQDAVPLASPDTDLEFPPRQRFCKILLAAAQVRCVQFALC